MSKKMNAWMNEWMDGFSQSYNLQVRQSIDLAQIKKGL